MENQDFEIIFVEKGSVVLELKDRVVEINQNECAWVLPYEIHRISTPKESKVSILIFSSSAATTGIELSFKR